MIKYKKQNFWNKREGYILITSSKGGLFDETYNNYKAYRKRLLKLSTSKTITLNQEKMWTRWKRGSDTENISPIDSHYHLYTRTDFMPQRWIVLVPSYVKPNSTCALNSIPSFLLKNFTPIILTCFTYIYWNVCSLPDNSHWLTSRLYFSHSEYERKYEVSLEPTFPACYLCSVLLPFRSNNPWITFLSSSLLLQFCLKSSPIRFCPQIYTHDSCC